MNGPISNTQMYMDIHNKNNYLQIPPNKFNLRIEQPKNDLNARTINTDVSGTTKGTDEVVNSGNFYKKPYSTSRPNYGKGQVEQVWENAKDPINGKVYDPSSVEIIWEKSKPRNGQWDMGHIPGEKYSEVHELYMNGTITKKEFLDWYRDPGHYELPATNRGHKYE